MKKGSHKNQIIITTLALLLAVVGYISYDNRDTFMNAKDVLSTEIEAVNGEADTQVSDEVALETDSTEEMSAVDAMVKLTENAQMEEDAQMMLEAKGFKNAVVSLSDDCCDVIVGKEDVTDEKRAQIEDIIKRKTNIGASNIVISTMD